MAKPTTSTGFALTLERTIAATPERVYEAFTQADQVARWFAPADDYTSVVHALDARVGGEFRFEMQRPDGGRAIAYGTYEELTRPKRLVFSWTWEDKPEHLTSRIIVSLEPSGPGTRLTLVHEQLPTQASADAHAKGWTGCLDRFVRLF